jgi:hypothetical protein
VPKISRQHLLKAPPVATLSGGALRARFVELTAGEIRAMEFSERLPLNELLGSPIRSPILLAQKNIHRRDAVKNDAEFCQR